MCGILGYSHRRHRTTAPIVSRALESIVHRGPDQQGFHSCDQVTLGATRLRILDLHGGDQPLFSANRDVVVVFNGEIFNQHELRAELIAHGYSFATHCDTEVVLNAFLHWGTRSFARLRGMFGIAIWVQSEGRLVLARDRMGIKPLYYCVHDSEIYFGSELKTIFAHPHVPRSICLDGLNAYLSLNYVPGPYTLVEGISKLMPGHMLEWKDGTVQVEPYVDSTPTPTPRTLEEACFQLDELLRQAVREQMVSDVPVGLWLSGGLDSSTVLHYACELGACNLNTFSVTFSGHKFNEGRYIREVSNFYGTRHSEFDLTDGVDLVGAIQRIAYYSDEPSADAGAIPLWFLSRTTSEKVTVALSGEGADELFAGYLTYKADRYAETARRVPALLRRIALGVAQGIPVSDSKISFEYKLKRFLQGSLMSPDMAHLFWNGTFSEQEKRYFFRFADPRPLAAMTSGLNGHTGLQRFLDLDQRYYLPDDILYKVDRISMAHSLEVRPPFLDPRLVDFAAGLPDNFKLNGSRSKFVLRQMMRDKLPKLVLNRPKVGFDIPIHEWFRGVLRPLLLDTICEESIASTGLFHWSAINRLLHDHLERRANLGYHLWGLMVLLLWMREWKIELPMTQAATSFRAQEAYAAEVGLLSQQPV
jgi:asparagine synthase (glutamine-hydrolysing)